MKHNILETIIGFLVIIIAFAFLLFAYRIDNATKVDEGYVIKASFQNAEGIAEGSDVMLAGIKIGFVKSIVLDKTSFFAQLIISIEKDIQLPSDSRAAIITHGIFGERYISITPGSAETNLAENEQIKYTQSALNLESLIGKLMYSFGSNK